VLTGRLRNVESVRGGDRVEDREKELEDETPLSDAELEDLALAADPDAPLDEDAVPMATFLGREPGLLPQWYMPPPLVRSSARWRVPVVIVIVAAFVVIEALGLCSTFGPLVPG
jgi:hypothetical protein